MQILEQAIEIALRAHAGARDKFGRPYILHPLHLMLQMETVEEQLAAVLHDVVEDSSLTLEELSAAGIPAPVVEALALLTHDRESQSYPAYVLALKANPLARKVKLADLQHNMDVRRLPQPLTDEDFDRLQRYRQAWDLLKE